MSRYSIPALMLLVGSLPIAARADEARLLVERGPAPQKPAYQFAGDYSGIEPSFLTDAPACYLYSGTLHRLHADGTVAVTTQEVIRLNNRRGIDQLGEYRSITYNPSYERLTLHAAVVHKSNGTSTPVAPRHLQVRDVNTDHLVYDSAKQVTISFPGLDVGDVLEIHWTVRGRHPEFGDQFFARYTFGNDKLPVARDEWSITLPKARTLKHAAINCKLTPIETVEGDQRTLLWTARNRPAPPAGERKPTTDEDEWQVAASTFSTWDEVYRWEKRQLADRRECPPAAREIVEKLTRGMTDPVDKARAITRWVRTNLRYVSRGEKHDYTPHPPALVMSDRCGDCKDNAHLLALMCRAAGLKAGCATLGPRGDGQVIESVPSPWGTHALTVITIDDRDYWIDTTASQLGWNVLPRDDCDRACFITDDAGIRLARTPKMTPKSNRTETTVTLTVSPNGDGIGHRTVRYTGVAAWTKREELAGLPLAERRRSASSDLQDAFPRAKLGNLTIEGLDDPDSALVVKAEFTCPELFAGEGSLEGRIGDLSPLTALLAASPNSERSAALDLGDPGESNGKFVIEVPAAYRLQTAPAGHEVKAKWGRVRVDLKSAAESPRRIEIESRTTISATRVAPAEFDDLRDFQDAVQAVARVALVLKPTRDPADVELLEAACSKTPEDATTAATLAAIYVGQKKYDDAQRILNRACGKSPNDRILWELRAGSAASLDEEVEIYREMVARFPDEPKYALDLADALIDQNEFADAKKLLDGLVNHKTRSIQAEALVSLARLYLEQDEPRKALRQLTAAEKADPESLTADTWMLKGRVLESMGQPKAAIEAYRRAAEPDEAVEALSALTRLSIVAGSRDDANHELRRFSASVEGDPAGPAQAADFAIQLGRVDDALEFARHARIDGKTLHPRALRPLGLALFQRGEFAQAAEHLGRAEPNAEVLTALGESLIALGRLGDAERLTPRFAAIEHDTKSRATAATIRQLAGRRDSLKALLKTEIRSAALESFICAEALHGRGVLPDRVDALLDESLSGGQPFGPALGLKAVLAVQRGRLTRALADGERAIALGPDHPASYHARGRARFERGQPGALDDLEKAAQLSRRADAAILHDLAAALRIAKRSGDALAVQREAAKLRPDDREIRGQLRELEVDR